MDNNMQEVQLMMLIANEMKKELTGQADNLNEWYEASKGDKALNTYLFFGIGNCKYVKKILEKERDSVRVIVYEPSLNVLKKIAGYAGMGEVIEDERVSIIVPELMEVPFSEFLFETIMSGEEDGIKVYTFPGYSEIYAEHYTDFLNNVDKYMDTVKLSRQVSDAFSEYIFKNTMANFDKLKESKSLADLFDKFDKNIPVILVAAGPSLNKNIEELRRAKGKALIISMDATLMALFRKDIIPDMYICLDPTKAIGHFQDERVKKLPVISFMETPPYAFFEGQLSFFSFIKNETVNDIVKNLNSNIIEIAALGSVANAAFSVVAAAGFKNIILIGQDLAYTNDQYHAEGTGHIEKTFHTNTIIELKGINGEAVKSSREFRLYKSGFEQVIRENPDLQVIDATEGGAYIEGTKLMTLKEVVDLYCREELDISEKIQSAADLFEDNGKETIDNYHKEIIRDFDVIISEARKCIAYYDEMYMIAKRGDLNPNRLKKIFENTDKINKKIDSLKAKEYVDVLNTESIFETRLKANEKAETLQAEILEAASLGKSTLEKLMEAAKKAKRLNEEINI